MKKHIHYNAPVIITMTLASLGVLLLGYLTNSASTDLLFSVYRSSPTDVFFYFRLLGHVLGHANWEHFISNFLLILILGPMLEEKYGSKLLLGMMAATAFVTAIINVVFFSHGLLGASGIVFMLILLSSFANFKKGQIPLTVILVALIYMGQEVINGIFTQDNISQLGHILGGLCGAYFGFTIKRRAPSASE